jgi:transposase-like protein
MLHKYRIAMVRSEREQLSGTVEIDETLIGGVEHSGKRGRGTDKAIVVIAVESKELKGFGRVRMQHIPNASGEALIHFICDAVKPGANVQTDG